MEYKNRLNLLIYGSPLFLCKNKNNNLNVKIVQLCQSQNMYVSLFLNTILSFTIVFNRYSRSYFYNSQRIRIRQGTGDKNKNFLRNDGVVRRKNKNQYTIKTVGGGGWGIQLLHKSLPSFPERVRQVGLDEVGGTVQRSISGSLIKHDRK